MAAKERKVRKRGGRKCPASEKWLALRAVPSSLPEGVKWPKNLFFAFFAFFCGHPPSPLVTASRWPPEELAVTHH